MTVAAIAIALAIATTPQAGSQAPVPVTTDALHPVQHAKGNKNPKKWIELIQDVQYDGEYSPPSGRQPEPEASATVPVRYIPPYMRQIPVIVKPAPRYVDADTIAQENSQREQAKREQVPGQQFGGQTGGQGGYQSNSGGNGNGLTAGPVTTVPGPLASAGSATGSTAIATYGALPNATVVTDGSQEKDD